MKRSAGVLLRRADGHVLLVHPGGPFWARKDAGAWSIPKGEHDDGEDPEACARREFARSSALAAPAALTDLGVVRQKNRKEVRAFYGEGDLDVAAVVSNTFVDGVAAAVGAAAGVPGDRPGGVVPGGRGAREAQPRAGRVPRPASLDAPRAPT